MTSVRHLNCLCILNTMVSEHTADQYDLNYVYSPVENDSFSLNVPILLKAIKSLLLFITITFLSSLILISHHQMLEYQEWTNLKYWIKFLNKRTVSSWSSIFPGWILHYLWLFDKATKCFFQCEVIIENNTSQPLLILINA